MQNSERLLGFLAAMFVTFGISDLDFSNLNFEQNQKAYAALGLVVFLFLIFAVRLKKSKQ